MRIHLLCLALLVTVTACDNFVPNPKVATYDPATGKAVPPHPCPDWSQSQTYNYLNEVHSNFGCAYSNDMALQLADPEDLVRGHGGGGPDTGVSTRVIEQYRAGNLPAPLVPVQSTTSSTSSQ